MSELLADGPLARDELVARIVARTELAGMEEQLRSGWGALLKPLAWQGALCHGPSRGTRFTFARPDALIPGWTGLPDPDEAAPVAIAAYLWELSEGQVSVSLFPGAASSPSEDLEAEVAHVRRAMGR